MIDHKIFIVFIRNIDIEVIGKLYFMRTIK